MEAGGREWAATEVAELEAGTFCSSPLWNSSLTWYTDRPQFTSCFSNTVLTFLPPAILLLLLPLELLIMRKISCRGVPWGSRLTARLAVTGLLAILALSHFIIVFRDGAEDTAQLVAPLVSLVGILASWLLILAAKRFGQIAPPIQFFYWLTFSICEAFRLASIVVGQQVGHSSEDDPQLTIRSVGLCLGLLMLLLQCLPDQQPEYTHLSRQVDNPSPQESASYPSRLILSWLDELIKVGWKKPLVQEDLWNLSYENSLKGNMPQFENLLDVTPLGKKSVLKPLVLCFYPLFLQGACYQLIYIVLQQASPQILNLLIAFVEEKQEMWKGYLFVVLLSLTSVLIALFDSWYWQQMRVVSMRVMTVLSSSIYRKALHLSAVGRQQYTAGEVVNLISVDCSKIEEAVVFINLMYTTPFQIVLTIYFVYTYLNNAAFVGAAVLFLLMPLNFWSWSVMESYQKKQMAQKDIRVNLINEVLNGIKVLKLYAWETSFMDKLLDIRKIEVNLLKKYQYLEASQFMIFNSAPFLVAIASFVSYVLLDPVNNVLDAQTAFVSLTLFRTLREPLFLLPFGINNIIQGNVSLKRINRFINAPETDPQAIGHDGSFTDPITVKQASFTWNPNLHKDQLRNLNFSIKTGSLVAVVGQVGAGKSSLLSSILGEMIRTKGSVNVKGSTAYVSQQAWIRNMTLKKNILFGKPFAKNLYEKVIDGCALRDDIAILADGEETEIGEKGINLSGGQKQRINLARAVYANCDIFLLDDPLSAVDSHVAQHIFKKVIGPKGILSKKTRILVTHDVSLLPMADCILVLDGGNVTEMGTYQELLDQKGPFAEFLEEQQKQAEDSVNQYNESGANNNDHMSSPRHEKSKKKRSKTLSLGSLSVVSSELNYSSSEGKSCYTEYKSIAGKKLLEEETAETAGVQLSVYIYFLKAMGLRFFGLGLTCYILFEAAYIGENFWLSNWSSDPAANLDVAVRNSYMAGYGGLGGLETMFLFVAVIFMTVAANRASVQLHERLLKNIMRSPMAFFDTTPTGRIVNRFSKDTDEADLMLPLSIKDFLLQVMNVTGVAIILAIVSPIMIAVMIVMVLLLFLVQRIFLKTSRQLKRLLSISRSPIYSHLEETLSGLATIRAFGRQLAFQEENEEKIEQLQMARYPEIISNSWLFIRLQLISMLMIAAVALVIVLRRDSIDPGSVGLSLSYVIVCQLDIFILVRLCGDIEKAIVSVERIKEYQEVRQEAALTGPRDPPASWPTKGHIRFIDFALRYRPDLELVLKGITCEIRAGEKIGIVGRTGAGKSSITLALFRIVEAARGQILIDGLDIAEVGLARLRSALTIIPQDPVFFSGCLRFNLDPFQDHSDSEIWRCLELVQIADIVKKLTGGLDYTVAEGGSNFSVGQRQLFCLVRALLRRTRILILDEATAAVDLETDDHIQATIRREFSECTVLTIAHRLRTIMDSDRVMVLDQGDIREMASPATLLRDRTSTFFGMAKDAGLVN